jgi:NADPH:quinone reductase-like Zn-dependent oxidoreductase
VVTTAHDALFTQCGLGLGDRLLVHGAAGGVGTAAVQLAAAAGARVVAGVRNPDHHRASAPPWWPSPARSSTTAPST